MVTSEPLLTRLNVEGVAHVTFEIDSAASHNIISENYFNQLQNQLKLRGKETSKKLDKTIKIRLADGKLANQNCKIVQIYVSTNLENSAKLLPLTFLVVKGPNNLIGRHSLARLWPKEFEQFKAVTTNNYNNYNKGLASKNKKSKCQNVNKTQINKVNSEVVDNVEILKSNIKQVNFKNSKVNSKVNSNCKKPNAQSGVKSKSISPAIAKAKQVIERQPTVSRQTVPAPLPSPTVSRQTVPTPLQAAALPAQAGLGANRPADTCDVTSWPPRRELPDDAIWSYYTGDGYAILSKTL